MSRLEFATVGDAANSVGGSENKDLRPDLMELASPIVRGEKLPLAIERAARASGLPYWRCWNIWYGKARHVAPHEYEQVAAALERHRKLVAAREVHELRGRLVRLESLLVQIDPEFHRDQIAALRGGR